VVHYVIIEVMSHVTQKCTSKECIGALTSQQLRERNFNLINKFLTRSLPIILTNSKTSVEHDNCKVMKYVLLKLLILYSLHEELQQEHAPVSNVPSTLDIILMGTYCHLPKCIEHMGMQTVLSIEELALSKLSTLLLSQLSEVSLTKEISNVIVSDDRIVLHVERGIQSSSYTGLSWAFIYVENTTV